MNSYKPLVERPLHGGTQRIYRFENGYGASVVRHNISYGTELAVIKFTGGEIDDYTLVYDTPVTDDVIGRLTEPEVNEYLSKIEALP